jgi:hypothetical protein
MARPLLYLEYADMEDKTMPFSQETVPAPQDSVAPRLTRRSEPTRLKSFRVREIVVLAHDIADALRIASERRA